MNIIFGIWRPNGPPVTKEELESMAVHTRRFAPDGEWLRVTAEIGFGVQAQYTHARSRLEVQPALDVVGNVIVYDGRLDNYRELMKEFDLEGENTPDSDIILCAYRQLGQRCFERLIGDWALTLWDARARMLLLSRDHAGTRTLHYSRDAVGNLTWATFLDPYSGTSLMSVLDPVYLSSYLAMLPCYSRTPYRDIKAILPGHFIESTGQKAIAKRFWTPKPDERHVSVSSDEYAAQFLHLFKQSVARRTGAGAPILAELSGGVDSSSIVCVSDLLRSHGEFHSGTLDTLSYFNDSDPDWNERPYFTMVEEKRHRHGFHIDASRYCGTFQRSPGNGALYLYPGIEDSVLRRDFDLRSIASDGGHRSILSGIGGDEFTGGTLDPAVEVADLFVRGNIWSALSSAFSWSCARRISLVDLLRQSALFVRDHRDSTHFDIAMDSIPWLTEASKNHCREAIRELPFDYYKPFVNRPVDADISETWWLTLRTQPHLKPSEVYRYEYRYPYLDRDFVEFLWGLPPDQLSRPGRRRFAMRRALQGIVPEEILERRRKAFLLSAPLTHIREMVPYLRPLIKASILVKSGYVDESSIQHAVDSTISGDDIRWWVHISRFAGLETWLQYRERDVKADDPTTYSVLAAVSTDRVPAW